MKIFLSGTGILKRYPEELKKCKYILESFYSVQEWQVPFLLNADMFLLDSGAFTFRHSKQNETSFDGYLQRYIDFINQYDVKYFFELDVDNAVGYEKVKEMRRTLEKGTGKQCIPVWHTNRGASDYLSMCDEYSYVAIGGIAGKNKNSQEVKRLRAAFPTFIAEAHKRGAIIHGLGYTDTKGLQTCHFDTVDSTTWIVGGKYGNVCVLENGVMRQEKPHGKRCIKQDDLMLHNYNQWLTFQRYAETKL